MNRGGLYDDLVTVAGTKDNRKDADWGSSKLMAPAMLRRKTPAPAPSKPIVKPEPSSHVSPAVSRDVAMATPSPASAPVPKQEKPLKSLLKKPASGGSTAELERYSESKATGTLLALSLEADKFADAYDPMKPNDYEECMRERRHAREERARVDREQRERDMREAAIKSKPQFAPPAHVYAESPLVDSGYGGPSPPSSPVKRSTDDDQSGWNNGESDTKRRKTLWSSKPPAAPAPAAPPPASAGSGNGGGSVAARLMAKMGYKEGTGLGKSGQGITAPLLMKKTDKRAGVIINLDDQYEKNRQDQKPRVVPPSHIVLLTNMVAPGEVDPGLQGEIGEECEKFGRVEKVTVFEDDRPPVPDEEVVRIFVEFHSLESAKKALEVLNGRMFAGRRVEARFYDPLLWVSNRFEYGAAV